MKEFVMRTISVLLGAASVVLSLLAAPDLALARTHRHHPPHHQYNQRCERARRHAGNTGTVVGAIGGALVGNSLSHGGGKTGGTLIGAGVGAVAGHQIAKHNTRC
jgi:uncharacterized protein YcfJ